MCFVIVLKWCCFLNKTRLLIHKTSTSKVMRAKSIEISSLQFHNLVFFYILAIGCLFSLFVQYSFDIVTIAKTKEKSSLSTEDAYFCCCTLAYQSR